MDPRPDPAWWEITDRDQLSSAVWEVTDRLRQSYCDPLRRRCLDLLTLYQGGVLADYGATLDQLLGAGGDVLSYNVCQSCSDTMIANLVANRVNPLFVTEGGNYEERQRAEGMQRGVEGIYREHDVWGARAEQTASDGVVWGLGATYVWADLESQRVAMERILPWEILVHPSDARRAEPRTLGVLLRVDRSVLRRAFADDPEAVRAIDEAEPAPADPDLDGMDESSRYLDRILVATWWHLPSGRVDRDDPASWGRGEDPVPHDGRRVVVVEGAVIADEPWPYERFPVAMFRPKQHRLGFRGRGVVEQLVGIQYEITALMGRISDIIRLYSMPLIYLWSQAGVNARKVATNEIGRVIQGRSPAGQAIQYITPQAVPSELWLQLDRLIEYAYRIVAFSEMSSQGQKPAGLQYAVGMQFLQDSESLRHMPTFRAWERYHVDLAALVVDALRQLALDAEESGKDFDIVWNDDRELKVIDWAKDDLDEMRYRLIAWPTNLLPQTPAARLDRVMWMFERQMIDRDTAVSLLPFPDIRSAFSTEQAALRDANKRIDMAVAGDVEAATPSSYSNKPLILTTALKRYQAMFADGATPETLDRLRTLIQITEQLIQQETPGGGAGAAVMGAAAPPPALPGAMAPPPGPTPPQPMTGA